jgi:hypothetical protein
VVKNLGNPGTNQALLHAVRFPTLLVMGWLRSFWVSKIFAALTGSSKGILAVGGAAGSLASTKSYLNFF